MAIRSTSMQHPNLYPISFLASDSAAARSYWVQVCVWLNGTLLLSSDYTGNICTRNSTYQQWQSGSLFPFVNIINLDVNFISYEIDTDCVDLSPLVVVFLKIPHLCWGSAFLICIYKSNLLKNLIDKILFLFISSIAMCINCMDIDENSVSSLRWMSPEPNYD